MATTLLKCGVKKLRNSAAGVWLVNLADKSPNPKRIRALLDPNPPIDVESELGSDAREKCAMDILSADASAISEQNNTKLQNVETGDVWVVLARNNNPADIVAKFICAKVLPDKDR